MGWNSRSERLIYVLWHLLQINGSEIKVCFFKPVCVMRFFKLQTSWPLTHERLSISFTFFFQPSDGGSYRQPFKWGAGSSLLQRYCPGHRVLWVIIWEFLWETGKSEKPYTVHRSVCNKDLWEFCYKRRIIIIFFLELCLLSINYNDFKTVYRLQILILPLETLIQYKYMKFSFYLNWLCILICLILIWGKSATV